MSYLLPFPIWIYLHQCLGVALLVLAQFVLCWRLVTFSMLAHTLNYTEYSVLWNYSCLI